MSKLDEAESLPLGHAAKGIGRLGEWYSGEGAEAASPMADIAQALSWGRDESEVVTELQAGSEAAFDSLVRHYHALVYNLLLQMLGNEADAADSTQEVFLKAFRGIRKFRRGSALKTWLYRIAIREALNQRRWFWRHRRNESSLDSRENSDRQPIELEGHGPDPFDQLAAREAQAVVRRALGGVPPVYRGAVILRDLEGLSYEEVAEILEVSVGTVKSRILRGRRALRELLEPLLLGHPAEAQGSPAGLSGEMAGGGE